jgi:tetratricopeptide (TPR) repeat protein
MKNAASLYAIALAIFAVTGVTLHAQGTGATVHGHVTNPAGQVVKTGDVKLTTDKNLPAKDRVYKFTFPIDSNGDFKGTNVQPGDYLAVVMGDGKVLDFQNVTLRSGEDHPMDFDMSRAEYLKSLTPEERAAIEEYKKKNAAVANDNQKIANINKTLLQAREDEKNGKAADAVKALQGLTEVKPDEAILWASLGEAQLKNGDDMTKAARAAKTPTTDPAIVQNYADAAVSYQKAIDLNAASKKPSPENLAAYYLNLGQADSKSGKLPEASAAYDMAAKTAPAMAASAYYNESVVFYTAGKNPEAAAAADKAIAADPKRAEAYYIKGQALIPGATADPKTGKFLLPPGCLEAYQEYLELAPDGPHAAEVKDLLGNLGQPVKNSFKAGKK